MGVFSFARQKKGAERAAKSMGEVNEKHEGN
jgi:hypothetical protein